MVRDGREGMQELGGVREGKLQSKYGIWENNRFFIKREKQTNVLVDLNEAVFK